MHDVELAAIEVADNARADVLVDIALHGNVDLAPAHPVMDGRVVNDEAVMRRASGALAGVDDERAVGGKDALPMRHGSLNQLCGREVDVDPRRPRDRLVTLDEPIYLCLLHGNLPLCPCARMHAETVDCPCFTQVEH